MGGSTPQQQITTTNEKGASQSQGQTTGSEVSGGSSYGTNIGTTLGGQQSFRDVAVPDWLKPLVQQSTGVAGTALTNLQDLTGGFQVPKETLDALTSTARGDFLFGGPQQQAFVDAAIRSAAPGVLSTFGAAGRGTGGLARTAINQAGVDAFANLFSQERERQLQAAQALPEFAAMPLQLQQQLLAGAGALPGQFAPFLGDTTGGATFGSQVGTNYGTTAGQSSSKSSTQQSGKTTGTTQQIQPLYQTPWWQTALGAGTALAGLAMPGLSGTSAIGNIIGGTRGLLGTTR